MTAEKPPWGLVADDATGAADSAAAFALAGFRAFLLTSRVVEPPAGAELLALSTDSRNAGSETAAARVREACRRLTDWGVPLLYKKIDSVLRGSPAAEIEAALETGGFGRAVVAPAMPAQGRVVEGGRVWVLNPLDGTRRAIEASLPRGPGVEIPDAATDADLDRVAADALERRPWVLPVGSAGLALAIARRLARSLSRSETAAPLPPDPRPPLLLIGSMHAATERQLARLRETRPAIEVRRDVWRRDWSAIRDLIRSGRRGALVLSGGDTARRALDEFEADGIEILGEIERGIPWGRVLGGVAAGRAVATKSGGFGGENALVAVVDALSGRARSGV